MSSPAGSDISDAPSSPAAAKPLTPDDSDAGSSPAAGPAKLDDMFSNGSGDDDAVITKRRKAASPTKNGAGSDEDLSDAAPADGDDLFGSDSDADMEDAPKPKTRTLDDEDLDSADDDDDDRTQRRGYTRGDDEDDDRGGEDMVHKEKTLPLHQLPGADGDPLYMLKVPPFITILPTAFSQTAFHATAPPDPTITPHNYHTTALRWRYNPRNPSVVESNSRIIRWSDGSLSLQIASSSQGIYDLPMNFLSNGASNQKPYDPQMDSHTYLAEPIASAEMMRTIAHIETELGVTMPAAVARGIDDVPDELKHLLSQRYANSAQRSTQSMSTFSPSKPTGNGKIEVNYKMEDPEKARREAEKLEKEQERIKKKKEAINARNEGNDLAPRHKTYRSRGGNLNAGDLEEDEEEDDDRRTRNTKKSASGGKQASTRQRHVAEDRAASKRNREEEYDYDDGFVEPDPDSDEEEEEAESSDEEEPEYVSKSKHKSPKSKSKSKGKSPKKHRRKEESEEEEDEEEEAAFTDDDEEEGRGKKSARKAEKRKTPELEAVEESDEDDGVVSKGPASKRRRVVADDSDEE